MQLREATPADGPALTECERAAYGTSLAHVFGDTPWPEAEIARRWADELVEPGVTTLAAVDSAELTGFATYDVQVLRHLGVVPARWGSGLADELHDEVLRRHGARPLRLWVLEQNTRARRFYTRRGWVADGRRERTSHRPYPPMVGMSYGGFTASASHSHLFRGAELEVHVGPSVPDTDLDPLGITFGDGSYATGALLTEGARGQVLAVDPYATAAGTAIGPAMWVVRDVTGSDLVRTVTLGSRIGG